MSWSIFFERPVCLPLDLFGAWIQTFDEKALHSLIDWLTLSQTFTVTFRTDLLEGQSDPDAFAWYLVARTCGISPVLASLLWPLEQLLICDDLGYRAAPFEPNEILSVAILAALIGRQGEVSLNEVVWDIRPMCRHTSTALKMLWDYSSHQAKPAWLEMMELQSKTSEGKQVWEGHWRSCLDYSVSFAGAGKSWH